MLKYNLEGNRKPNDEMKRTAMKAERMNNFNLCYP